VSLLVELPPWRERIDVKAALPGLLAGLVAAAPAAAQVPTAPAPPRAFLGGVPDTQPPTGTLSLTLLDAIDRGLAHNLGLLTAGRDVDRAQAARWQALSDLLPSLDGRLALTREQVNLKAFGFPLPAGVPSVVGPFNVFDARLSLSQSVFDLSAIDGARAEAHGVAAAQHSYQSARDLVVLVTANLYLQSLAGRARVASVQAQLDTAQALYDQAVDLRNAGLVAAIDVLRAQVELNTAQQRLTQAQNDLETSKLQLAHVIGLPLGQAYTLVDEIPYVPVPQTTLQEALDEAYRSRPDYLAALERVRAAEARRSAVAAESLPSAKVTADYGDIGPAVSDSHGTFNVTGAVSVPILSGGDRHGRLIQADAALRDRQAEADDLRAGIYYEVRTTFLNLQASEQVLKTADQARTLAADELTQARDRFAAGVASNIEVIQAQGAVALANEQYTSALYQFNVNKALLARGVGAAERLTRQFLGGLGNGR
jgi:outer membrane protein TolC